MFNKIKNITLLRINIIILCFLFLCCKNVFTQTRASNFKTITAEFTFPEVNYDDIAVITNVLKVKNNNGKNYTFTISLNLPTNWKALTNEEKEYVLKPNDSVYIPVRIVTSNKKVKGGTKYSISAYINTNEGKQMAFARFIAGRPKITNWQMHVLPRPRIYFLNEENTAQFQLHLVNDGDEKQDLLVNYQKIGKGIYIGDTIGKTMKRNYFELSLPPLSDTTLYYSVTTAQDLLNQRRIDVWGFDPNAVEKEKRYGLFIRASDLSSYKNTSSQKSKKLDFVKLANSLDFVKLSNSTLAGNGSNALPLTAFLNVSNLMGLQPNANLSLFGNSQVGKNALLNYNMQTFFSYYGFTKQFYTQSLQGNVNLNYKKLLLGMVSGGGNFRDSKGFKSFYAGYQFSPIFYLTGSYNRLGFFGPSNTQGFQLGAGINLKVFTIGLSYGLNLKKGLTPDYFYSASLNYSIKNFGQSFSFNRSIFSVINQQNTINTNIWSNTIFSFKKIRIFTSYGYNEGYSSFTNSTLIKNYSNNVAIGFFGEFKRYTINYNSSVSSFGFKLINESAFLPTLKDNGFSFNNTINFIKQNRKSKVLLTPSFFVNLNKFIADTVLNYGVIVNVAQSNYENEFFMAGNVRLGYNTLFSSKYNNPPSIFFSQTNLLVRYKVWNFIALYTYGSLSLNENANIINGVNSNLYPQSFRFNISNQYQFKKKKNFVIENNLTYVYLNTRKSSSISFVPQLFYFTKNKVRFGFNANINYNSSLSKNFYPTLSSIINQNTNPDEVKRMKSSAVFFGFNVKRDFNIPLPKKFRNNKYCDAKFVVFLDLNGDKRMNENEVPVENVVLRMNEFEVLTDANGSASFINISFAKYRLQVLPLVDMGSWFPNVGDSLEVCGPEPIYLPFSKGVQVYGNVELDREAQSGELYQKLDVSRFKIYLTDTTGKVYSSLTDINGNFSFYVPFAKYVLHFDEKVLGSNFYLPDNDIELDLSQGIESYFHHFLIIEKKRKVRKKIFGPDGKVTYVDETAESKKDKEKLENKKNKDSKNNSESSSSSKNGSSGMNGSDGMITFEAKFKQLDSLLDVLNRMIMRAATKPDVRAIVHQEMQLLINELNATFTIVIEELPKSKNPTGILLQLLRMKKVEEVKQANGTKTYISGDYKNITDAEKFCKDFQSSGFRKAKVAKRTAILNSSK